MNVEYWLQHNIGKRVEHRIHHKVLVPHEALQSPEETQTRERSTCGAVAIGPGLSNCDGAASPLSQMAMAGGCRNSA